MTRYNILHCVSSIGGSHFGPSKKHYKFVLTHTSVTPHFPVARPTTTHVSTSVVLTGMFTHAISLTTLIYICKQTKESKTSNIKPHVHFVDQWVNGIH